MLEKQLKKSYELLYMLTFELSNPASIKISMSKSSNEDYIIFSLCTLEKQYNFSSIHKLNGHLQNMILILDDNIPSFTYFPSMEGLMNHLTKSVKESNS